MKPTEIIKTPSFMAIDNMSSLIYNKFQEAVELEAIKTNVSRLLMNQGSSSFVSLYNKAITTKDYSAFTENLNINLKKNN
jgi:hypothetical protein